MKPSIPALIWRRLPAALALILLVWQASIPWIAGHYVTQDGPSHLYSALVFKDLVLHPHGFYASVYRFQPRLVTNWASVVILGLLAPIVGVTHAEQCFASLLVITGFLCVSYFRKSIDPSPDRTYDPISNCLLNTWFFWIGFYDFYLGMAICLVLVGFYIRHAKSFSARNAAILAAGLVALFFVHVMPATVAIMGVASVAIWVHIVLPGREDQPSQASKPLRLLAAATAPALILLFFFVRHAIGRIAYAPAVAETLRLFPMHVFAVSRGRAGEEALLVPVMTAFMTIGVLTMKSSEWFTERAALVLAAFLSFLGYLLAPNSGFGGGEIKLRLAWSIFAFGCPLAASLVRLRWVHAPLSIYIAWFLAMNLATTTRSTRGVARAADLYAAALEHVPADSNIVRLRYNTEETKRAFDFDQMAMEPLFHADAWMASRRHLIDLTDAFALSRVFPICFRKEFTTDQQNWLYEMEDGESHGIVPLAHVLDALPVSFDYVVLVGDKDPEAPEWLGGKMDLIATANPGSFVRVYQRSGTP